MKKVHFETILVSKELNKFVDKYARWSKFTL